jgi:murein DD-endopeptidase MepM/ murein hydrolase activator NlpD
VVGLGWLTPAGALGAQTANAPKATTTTPSSVAPATTTTTMGRGPATTVTRATTTTALATTTTSTVTATTFPPALLAIANSVRRSAPSNDAALIAALAPLKQLGYTGQQAMLAGMGQFPVAGPAFYTDDWLEPRPGPVPALHHGDDIICAMGTPIRSPIDGVLKYDTSDPKGYGLAAIITGPDKTFYLNGHLSATVTGLATGSAVKQGQVVGFVGQSGDAQGPHDHFEVHPLGGAGVDPKPILDAWQAAALRALPSLVSLIKGEPASTATPAAPLPVALPAPQAAFSPALPGPRTSGNGAAGSLAGLALLGLLCLIASSGLAVNRHRPVAAALRGRDGPHGDRPTPAG